MRHPQAAVPPTPGEGAAPLTMYTHITTIAATLAFTLFVSVMMRSDNYTSIQQVSKIALWLCIYKPVVRDIMFAETLTLGTLSSTCILAFFDSVCTCPTSQVCTLCEGMISQHLLKRKFTANIGVGTL